ncbi:MAG TPA: hypothetical protein VFR90_06830 [Methylibium sp.]|uniref:hypothetical protein n=1 Tax=Methylibium sp. TaxID=2067992 RepID=UPI002DB79DBE|nr:hypothetical protein [Methylibium sp.]HEU4458820.1 hypothetical protein [Methylibium sp.]
MIAIATVVVLGAGGLMLYQSQRIEVQVQAPPVPASSPEPKRRNIGDVDSLPPVVYPDNRTPAQKAADPKR